MALVSIALQKAAPLRTWPAAGKRSGGTNVVQGFELRDVPLPGWTLQAVEAAGAPGRVRTLRSLWNHGAEGRQEVLSLDVCECVSVDDAREHVFKLLGAVDVPLVGRVRGELAVGDVAFSDPHGYCLLFAVGNVVVLVHAAGRDRAPVTRVAHSLERHLRRLQRH